MGLISMEIVRGIKYTTEEQGYPHVPAKIWLSDDLM